MSWDQEEYSSSHDLGDEQQYGQRDAGPDSSAPVRCKGRHGGDHSAEDIVFKHVGVDHIDPMLTEIVTEGPHDDWNHQVIKSMNSASGSAHSRFHISGGDLGTGS